MNNSKQCAGDLWKLPMYHLCLFIVCLLPFLEICICVEILSTPILLPSLRRGLLLQRTVFWSSIWHPAVSKYRTSLPLAELHLPAKYGFLLYGTRENTANKRCVFLSFLIWDNVYSKMFQSLHWICHRWKFSLSPDNTISLLKSEIEKYKLCLVRTDHRTCNGAILNET